MISKGIGVFKGIVFSREIEEMWTSIYKDLCKNLGIIYLDIEEIILWLKNEDKNL